MKVLLVGKGEHGYGNYHTCVRICDALEAVDKNLSCQYFPLSSSENEDIAAIKRHQPDIVIGIHLRRCALLMQLSSEIPYLLICGGTDINEDINAEDHVETMTKAISKSRGLIVFSSSMERQLLKTFNKEITKSNLKVWKIPQTVVISPTISEESFCASERLGLPPGTSFFLVVGRIRAVKDPCFIMQPFYEWVSEGARKSIRLVFLGGIDNNPAERSEHFLEEVEKYSEFVHHVGNLGVTECQLAVRQALGMINCSLSEGQALSILEAMALGTPLIVRNIPGNADIVKHLKTGLLFDDSKTFQSCLSMIADKPELRKEIVVQGKKFIEEHHGDIRIEGQRYKDVIDESFMSEQ